jgi:hypothetical protein
MVTPRLPPYFECLQDKWYPFAILGKSQFKDYVDSKASARQETPIDSMYTMTIITMRRMRAAEGKMGRTVIDTSCVMYCTTAVHAHLPAKHDPSENHSKAIRGHLCMLGDPPLWQRICVIPLICHHLCIPQ